VGRLLKKRKYTLKVNRKTKETGHGHPDRETQFAYIEEQKQAARAEGVPMISVDTKKKELIGDVKNAGQTWRQEPEAVNTHDFPQDALCRAVPYGIDDLQHNRGAVYVGTSADAPSSLSRRSPGGGRRRGASPIPAPTACRSSPTQGAATAAVHERGSMRCRPTSRIASVCT